jgi:predicted MFS family arabinose efflux permease
VTPSSAVGDHGVLFAYLTSETAVNSVVLCQTLFALSMLVIWTISDSLAPLVVFVVLNGASSGAYFSITSSAIAQLFRSSPVQTTLSLAITGWVRSTHC